MRIGQDAATRPDEAGSVSSLRSDSIEFSIRLVPHASLHVEPASTKGGGLVHATFGTSEIMGILGRQVRVYLSPLERITIRGRGAAMVGIDHAAQLFAFFHPLRLSSRETIRLIELARRCKSDDPHCMNPAWLDLLLIGGFCYFDLEHRLLRVNALTSANPQSPCVLMLDGPHEANLAAAEHLEEQGRMVPVTADEVRRLGFERFGWVTHMDALPEGMLGVGGHAEPLHGAFLYSRECAKATKLLGACYYYRVVIPEDERRSQACNLAKPTQASSDAEQSAAMPERSSLIGDRARALDEELRRSLVGIRNVIMTAHQAVGRQFADEARVKLMASRIVHGYGENIQRGRLTRFRRRWTRRDAWVRRLKWIVPSGVSIIVAVTLQWVAVASSSSKYRPPQHLLASLIFFSCLTVLTWTVLRDTATEGLSTAQIASLRVRLPAIPLAAIFVEFLLLSWNTTAPYADVMALSIAYALAYVALPLAIFTSRLRATNSAVLRLQGGVSAAEQTVDSRQKPSGVHHVRSPRPLISDEIQTSSVTAAPCSDATMLPVPPAPLLDSVTWMGAAGKALPPKSYSRTKPNSSGHRVCLDRQHDMLAVSVPLPPPQSQPKSAATSTKGVRLPPEIPFETASSQTQQPSLTESDAQGPGGKAVNLSSLAAVAAEWVLGPWRRVEQILHQPPSSNDDGEHHDLKPPDDVAILDDVHVHGGVNPLANVLANQSITRTETSAAVRLQTHQRRRAARQHLSRALLLQQKRHCYVSRALIASTSIEVVGSLLLEVLDKSFAFPPWLKICGWLLLLLPSVVVVMHDVIKSYFSPEEGIRFSICHAVFFAASLYRISFNAAVFSTGVLRGLSDYISTPNTAFLAGYCIHMVTFFALSMFAKLTLRHAGVENAFAHLLAPFHFFEMAFGYAFFALRSAYVSSFSGLWLATTCLMQANIIMRNSGTYEGLISLGWRRFLRWHARRNGQSTPPNPSGPEDALFKLQFYARVAIQYDLADITAMLVVPMCVTLFVARDGWFALDGTPVLVRPCDLDKMWLHFLILLLIKPLSSFWIARKIVASRMARTLLGMKTIHGRSSIAPELLRIAARQRKQSLKAHSMRNLISTQSWSGRAFEQGRHTVHRQLTRLALLGRQRAVGQPKPPSDSLGQRKESAAVRIQRHVRVMLARRKFRKSRDRCVSGIATATAERLTHAILDAAFDRLGFSQERKAIFARDFELDNLDFKSLYAKTVGRSWIFFSWVAVFELFAIFPRYGLSGQDQHSDFPLRVLAWVHIANKTQDGVDRGC